MLVLASRKNRLCIKSIDDDVHEKKLDIDPVPDFDAVIASYDTPTLQHMLSSYSEVGVQGDDEAWRTGRIVCVTRAGWLRVAVVDKLNRELTYYWFKSNNPKHVIITDISTLQDILVNPRAVTRVCFHCVARAEASYSDTEPLSQRRKRLRASASA